MAMRNKTSLAEAMSKTTTKVLVNNKIGADKNSEAKKIIITVSPEAHYQFKKLSVEERSQIQTLAKEALNDLFVKYKLPPIA